MADFNAIVADVYTITGRPDLVAETILAVKSATLQLHRSDYFYKDLFETALQYSIADYLQTIEYRTLFPQYRSLKYLRKFDPTSTDQVTKGVGRFFDILAPEQVVDAYGYPRSDICYVAGSVIQIKSSTQDSYSLIGVYLNPVIATPETYNSWIADESHYAVVWAAVSIMYGSILNNTAKKNTADASVAIEFTEVKNSNIVAKGE